MVVCLHDLVISKKQLVDTRQAISRLPKFPKPDEAYSNLLTTFEKVKILKLPRG